MPNEGSTHERSRRSVVKSLGIAGIAGLAGCSGSGGGDGGDGGGGDNGNGGDGGGGGDSDNGNGGDGGATATMESQQVEITFWDYFGGTEDAEMKALTEEFESENPDVTVNTEAVPFSDMVSKLKTAAAAGNAPHVASYWMSFSSFFKSEGVIDPVDQYLEDGLEPYYDIVEPAARADGDIVALPMDIHAMMLATNDTVLEEAGAPMEPTTNEEFREAANAVKENTDARPFFYQTGNNLFAGFRAYHSQIRQQGGQMFEDGEPVFHETDAGLAAAEWMDSVTGENAWDNPDDISDGDIRVNEFKNDEAAMGFIGNWTANQFQDENDEWLDIDFTYHPPWGFGGDTNQTFCESNGMFFPKNSDHTDAEKRAAVRFVEYVTQNNPIWATKGTHLPPTPEVAESDTVINDPIYTEYEIVQTLSEMASNGALRYQPRATINLYAPEIGNPLSDIYAQNLDPGEAITQSANAISDRMS